MQNELSRPLSGEEVSELLDGKVKIITYKDISEFNTLDDLLAPYGRCVVLYESKPGNGHWVLIHRLNKNNVEVYDSYGLGIDDELEYIDENFRKNSNQLRAHLSQLLSKCKEKVHYNNHQFQELAPDVKTCGRWAVFRALNPKMSIDKFYKSVMHECREYGMSPDELCCLYVEV
jgi:hypothetical protein